MKKINVIIWVLLSTTTILASCNSEDALTPTEGLEYGYTLPQGDHDFDHRIMNWYEKCNFYILYKFNARDAFWNFSQWDGTREDNIYPDDKTFVYDFKLAEEKNIGQYLTLLEEHFLSYYPDTFLTRTMPLKLLIADELSKISYPGKEGELTEIESIYIGYDNVLMSRANEEFINGTDDFKREVFHQFHSAFLKEKLAESGEVSPGTVFFSDFTYQKEVIEGGVPVIKTITVKYDTNQVLPENGFITRLYLDRDRKRGDTKDFITAALMPVEYLTKEVQPSIFRPPFEGVLHPNIDVNGRVRYKYKLLFNDFEEKYHIDLKAIYKQVHGKEYPGVD